MSHHICHITTIHPAFDTRIFQKECVSLHRAGYQVSLLVCNQESQVAEGVRIQNFEVNYRGRIDRFRKTGRAALRAALELDADLYHFHDPELLPVGRKLVRHGKIVIYDAHEDVPLQILSKPWIPKPMRRLIASLFRRYENRILRKLSAAVVANPPMVDRFARQNENTRLVCNYPDLQRATQVPWSEKKEQVAYVGSLTRVRGIMEMVRALEGLPVRLQLGGKWHFASFQQEVQRLPAWQQVDAWGFINRAQINEMLGQAKVGLSILHPIPNYQQAYSVKVFEYMAAGIPVVVSNFPMWQAVVEKHQCGLCVDPLDLEAVQTAIRYLLEHPEEAQAMGQRGQKAAYQYYHWESQAQVLRELYQELLGT